MIFKCVESGPKEVYQVSWSSKLTTVAYMVDPKKGQNLHFILQFLRFLLSAVGGLKPISRTGTRVPQVGP